LLLVGLNFFATAFDQVQEQLKRIADLMENVEGPVKQEERAREEVREQLAKEREELEIERAKWHEPPKPPARRTPTNAS
jgi:hypothetical protein